MKKLTAIFLCFAMALSLAACGNTTSSFEDSLLAIDVVNDCIRDITEIK